MILLGDEAEDYKGPRGGLVIPDIENCELVDSGSFLTIKHLTAQRFWEITTGGNWNADKLLMLIADGITRANADTNCVFIRVGARGTELFAVFTRH
jgi:hypothetical protein